MTDIGQPTGPGARIAVGNGVLTILIDSIERVEIVVIEDKKDGHPDIRNEGPAGAYHMERTANSVALHFKLDMIAQELARGSEWHIAAYVSQSNLPEMLMSLPAQRSHVVIKPAQHQAWEIGTLYSKNGDIKIKIGTGGFGNGLTGFLSAYTR